MKRLSPERRKKIEARAAELIAEELTLRELRRPPFVLAGLTEDPS